MSSDKIMEEVWGSRSETSQRALWTLISRLRKKLESQHTRLEIVSQRGGGYTLEQL